METLPRNRGIMLRWAVLQHDDTKATISYTLPSSVYSSSGSTAMVAAMAVSDRIASEKASPVKMRAIKYTVMTMQ